MSYKNVLLAFISGMAIFSSTGRAQDQVVVTDQGKPNVILVITDDQGYGDLSCHGNPVIKTPELDKLHAESIRFTDFHVNPLCAPTRGALMSGHYTNRAGDHPPELIPG